MKKISVLLSMCLFVMLTASNVFAYFEENHLILSAYLTGNNEVGVDLGDLSTMDLDATNLVLAEAGSLNLGQFSDITDWSGVQVGIYGSDKINWVDIYATNGETNPGIKTRGLNGFYAGIDYIRDSYDNDGTQVAVLSPGDNRYDRNGYQARMNYFTAEANYAYISRVAGQPAEGRMELLDNGADHMDMYLYAFDLDTPIPGDGVDYRAKVSIFQDGSIVLNATDTPEVPVPGAFVLLASGLLGVIGIRRKNA
jgi:hypothetical protein